MADQVWYYALDIYEVQLYVYLVSEVNIKISVRLVKGESDALNFFSGFLHNGGLINFI